MDGVDGVDGMDGWKANKKEGVGWGGVYEMSVARGRRGWWW